MSETKGWIKLYRQIEDNPIWISEPFTRGQAWVDLLILARHKDGEMWVRDNLINLKRGDIGRSETNLADRWSWSRTKLRSFLKMLEKKQQIKIERSKVLSIISIVNYDDFQTEKTSDDTTGKHQEDDKKTTRRRQENINKNGKKGKTVENGKNGENNSLSISAKSDPNSEFLEIWKQFLPFNRKGDSRAEGWKKFKKAQKDGFTLDEIKDALRSLAELNKTREPDFRKGFSTWLHVENIKSALENEDQGPRVISEKEQAKEETFEERIAREAKEKFGHLANQDFSYKSEILSGIGGINGLN